MKKVYIYLYEQSVLWEVVLFMHFLKATGHHVLILADNEEITTFEGMKVKADYLVDEINPENIDALVITGGDITKIKKRARLNELILSVHHENKNIGAICGARNILLDLNLVTEEDLQYEDIKRKDNLLISPPYKYVDFAIELGSALGIYKDKADYEQTIDFFKLFKNV